MSKKRLFIPLAAFSLLLTSLIACNGGNNSKESQKPEESSIPPASETSSAASSSESKSSSSTPDVKPHVHAFGDTPASTVKNSDAKDVSLYRCTADDNGKLMTIAFKDFSEKSDDFDSAANASKYGEVASSIWDDAYMLAKSSNTTISWKVSVDKAITGAKLEFGINSTYDSHGDTDVSGKFQVKVNDGEFAAWEATGTYSSIGLSPAQRTYVVFKTINLAAGENVITLKQANQSNRLIFGGDVKISYEGDAVPVAEQFAGYNVSFALQHCSVLVYESGQDYSVDPVTPENNVTKARDELGHIVAYTGDPNALEPQVNFKIVPEAGYEVDTTCITVSGVQGTNWNSLKDVAGTETTIGEGDNAQKVVAENTFRVTKIRSNITITVNAVAEGTLKEGYVVTFNLQHCTVKVYTNKKFDEEDTATPYMSRAKGKKAPYPYCKGENAQFSFEVIPEEGYEFVHGLTLTEGECEADDCPFIAPNGYNKIKVTDNVKFNLTKVSRNLTITITCTQVQAGE